MSSFMKEFEHIKIQLDVIKQVTNNFGGDNYLGRGGFGKVYRGELFHSEGPIMVAVKRLDREFGQGAVEFWKEIMMLSCYKHANLVSLVGFCTPGYCDPMYAETMLLTKESDVYSFGVGLFEVLCSRPCIDYNYNDHRRVLPTLAKNYYETQTLHTIINDNLKRQITQASLDTFAAIAYQCLQRDRGKRPSMDLIVSKLEAALEYQEGTNVLARNVKNLSFPRSSYTSKDILVQKSMLAPSKRDAQRDVVAQEKTFAQLKQKIRD
ncbi:hypothetical protein L1987_02791 [Smallanthus sonchifolius]|uniref:Uncharacterized protein n=1 Tax=Smallanthus sonchifolius TaxID=185202 RepID=A0ACB9K8Y3_9ASTR|nr:hypothetical protein L1987_02791 [Smallanthus sonchifolius]